MYTRKNGHKEFKFLGTDANANFRAHADRLAQEVGIPNSGKVLPGSARGYNNYANRKVPTGRPSSFRDDRPLPLFA